MGVRTTDPIYIRESLGALSTFEYMPEYEDRILKLFDKVLPAMDDHILEIAAHNLIHIQSEKKVSLVNRIFIAGNSVASRTALSSLNDINTSESSTIYFMRHNNLLFVLHSTSDLSKMSGPIVESIAS